VAIKGLTCKESRSVGAIEILGRLRKGAPKNGGQVGKDLDHFRFDSTDVGLTEKIKSLYGDRPGDSFANGIRFYFPSSDLEQNMPTAMAAYKGGSCWVLCDREQIIGERVDAGKNGWRQYPAHKRPDCRWPHCIGNGKDETCNAVGKLRIIIPEFQRFGVVEVVVGALNDLEHVSKQLEEIRQRVELHGGDLSKVPLLLYRKARSISTPNGEGKRARRSKSLIEVVITPEFMGRSLSTLSHAALSSAGSLGGSPVIALPPVAEPLNTASYSDEFGPRPDLSYTASDEWAQIRMAFDAARSPDQVAKAKGIAIELLKNGQLPDIAKGAIARAAESALQRIEESGVEPVDVEVLPRVPSVKDRFEAIAALTQHTMSEVEALAKSLSLDTDNVSEWSDSACRKLRNRLMALSPTVAKGFDSPDSAIAAFKAFGSTSAFAEAENDAAIWQAWRSHSTTTR
jgi:hypothetical protein